MDASWLAAYLKSIATILAALLAATAPGASSHQSQLFPLQQGDRVQVTESLFARATAGGTLLRPSQKKNAQGTVMADMPQKAKVGGVEYTWYRVDWDQAPDGWSAGGFIEKVPAPKHPPAVTISVVGEPEIVIPKSAYKCTPSRGANVQDGAVRVFRDNTGKLHVSATNLQNLWFTTSSFAFSDIVQNCNATILPQYTVDRTRTPDPQTFSQRKFIGNTFTLDGNTVYAYVHNEFHGEDYNSLRTLGCVESGTLCWLASTVIYVSTDKGYNFTPAPRSFLASSLYPFTPTLPGGAVTRRAGARSQSQVFKGRDGAYYMYIGRVENIGPQKSGMCLARSTDLLSWYYWDGVGFTKQFENPYTSATAKTHVCPIVNEDSIFSVVYNREFDVFIGSIARQGRFYYATTKNLTDWSEKKYLRNQVSIDGPSFIDHESASRNFDTTGLSPYLYFGDNTTGDNTAEYVSRVKLAICDPSKTVCAAPRSGTYYKDAQTAAAARGKPNNAYLRSMLESIGIWLRSLTSRAGTSPTALPWNSPAVMQTELAPILAENKRYPLMMSSKATGSIRPDSLAYKNTIDALKHYKVIWGGGNEDAIADFVAHIKGNGVIDGWGDAWPSKVMISGGAYGGVGSRQWKYVYPGHLLYGVGTKITQISATPDSDGLYTMRVEDPLVVARNQESIATYNKGFDKNEGRNHMIITIYPLIGCKPDWNRAEYVRVEKMEERRGDVIFKVRRDEFREEALGLSMPNQKLTAGNAVAAVPFRFWSGQLQVNFSLDSPVVPADYVAPDADAPPFLFARPGELGAEWFARTVASRVRIEGTQGVEFDVARWTWGRQNERNQMDANNDLIVDHGYFNGVNSFGLGGRVFHETLRKLLGPNSIIQTDSTTPLGGVRDWKYLSGIHMEAFPGANDYDRFAESFTHLRLWAEKAGFGQAGIIPLSYPFAKTATEAYNGCTVKELGGVVVPLLPREREPKCADPAFMAQYKGLNARIRINLAAATMIDMPSPYMAVSVASDFDPDDPELQTAKAIPSVFDWDEYHRGADNVWEWLGKPTRPLLRTPAYTSGNLLAGAQWALERGKDFQASPTAVPGILSAYVTAKPNSSVVMPNESWAGVRWVPRTRITLAPGKEYTITFDARGDDDWTYKGKTILDVPRLVTVFAPMVATRDRKAQGVLVTSSWRSYSLTFTAAACPSAPADPSCPPAGIRAPFFGLSQQIGWTEIRNVQFFEGSGERWSREYEGGLVLLNMSKQPWIVPVAGPYRRIRGTVDPLINNGQPVTGGYVIVPPRDALFLVRTGL